MASLDQLRKISIYCTKYKPREDKDSFLKSSTETGFDSCVICSHFTEDKRCELNLIDKVLSSLSMENELKS